ncbi:Rne/Rng family ribonuclease [Amycolatopsis thermalba]|uniref:Rne/Rng family ribonuclease n=1 Tax=Amycolatopsis thermalba TaxID=944492 RepID=A0ABY4NTN5_9PSEU|nr:Rne/Rng family ribonuclease [Amycolatopsis thermalba]UQS23413.1 Rne/Rng family ribonuclease [Amycolatopsis thermalba]
MSNADTPAENTGGNTALPATGPLGELPPRVRVHALAKLLGSNSRVVLAKLSELGETARSAQSSVPREVAVKVAEALAPADEQAVEEAAAPEAVAPAEDAAPAPDAVPESTPEPVVQTPATPEPATQATPEPEPETAPAAAAPEPVAEPARQPKRPPHMPVFAAPSPVFLPPEAGAVEELAPKAEPVAEDKPDEDADEGEDGAGRRRRRRGRRGRGRGKGGDENATETTEADETDDSRPAEEAAKAEDEDTADEAEPSEDTDETEGSSRRRRRRRRRKGSDGDAEATTDDPPNTVVHVRETKAEDKDRNGSSSDGVRSVRGSTRLEAKRQRRRDGREAGRRRAPILSEAEFLARRESVERTMVVAERGEHTQIGVLEDSVLVEHFVTSQGSGSIVGNVYLGRVQNVLPSMEAAFVDIGRGRNAVLYAGEVDWDAAGLEGKSRKIEQALSTGDNVLVQVTKDPVGHKGARLTTQISLPGRFLVYMPSGGATGISRKLPENERRRLKDILKRIVPEDAGVIIRTASEGISEEELERDVRRLKAQWEVVKEKADAASSGKKSAAPVMLYEEPDLLVKVVRDLFTEDFVSLEVQGDTAWETIRAYVEHVAPDLTPRLKRYVGTGDVLAEHRIDEQLTKALDRKVWLPSGGYLVIDRTEAMTVIDVNTGKFTGSGGNLEETVTRNNLESAEEIVRQLRLRDIGGIIVIDFIDMVLESNRELVLKRLTECLGRDRTRHQVAEVTSLGLVQMTRKKIGTGLLEAFSTTCEHCKGRGVIVSTEPVKSGNGGNGGGHQHGGGGGGSRRSRGRAKTEEPQAEKTPEPSPVQRESTISAVEAMAKAAKIASTKTEGGEKADTAEQNGAAPATEETAVPEKAAGGRSGRRSGARARREAEPAQPEEASEAGSQAQPAAGEPAGQAQAAGQTEQSAAAQARHEGAGQARSEARPEPDAVTEPQARPETARQAEPQAQPAAAGEPAGQAQSAAGQPAAEARPEAAPQAQPRAEGQSERLAPAQAGTQPQPAAGQPAAEAGSEGAPQAQAGAGTQQPEESQPGQPPAAEQAKPARTSRTRRVARRPAAPPEPVQAATEPSQPVTVPAGPVETPAATTGQDDATDASPEVSVPTPATRTASRRPRRAASRPAGPPVHASDQS